MTATIVSPRLMRIGGGSVAQAAEVLALFGLARPLVVTDPWMVSSGTVERALLAPLRAAGIAFDLFSDTVPDPTDTVIEAGAALLRGGNHDCLIGFGGGSPIDTAKAMAILPRPRRAQMRDFKVPRRRTTAWLPVICHPDHRRHRQRGDPLHRHHRYRTDEKMLIAGLGALPLAAIVDYQLTLQRAAADHRRYRDRRLTHALEAYVSKRANPHPTASRCPPCA